MTLAPGVHGIVGPNGSGKSTLLKLALGLYQPSEGRVLLDGADIAQFARAELAAWVGYVPQETILFSGTLRDNIALRRPATDDAAIVAAATLAVLHDFIVDLPDGYATEVGEAGRRLSAGQRQRIAIARALLGDPPILLLDEPSSHLDRDGENGLRRMMETLGQRATVVIVTHSPPLLAACRTITMLDGGRVIFGVARATRCWRISSKAAGFRRGARTQAGRREAAADTTGFVFRRPPEAAPGPRRRSPADAADDGDRLSRHCSPATRCRHGDVPPG